MILACCLFSHFTSILLLHNSKAKYLKKQQGPVSLGKGWGLISCAPSTLWQLCMITSWRGSPGVLQALGGFVAGRQATHSTWLAFTKLFVMQV